MTQQTEQALDSKQNQEEGAQDNELGSQSAFERIPFGFARRFGLLVEERADQPLVIYKEGLASDALMEVQRHLGRDFRLECIDDKDFERRLGLAYQSDSSEAMEMVEGLGDDMDLASLADSVPETEDLLEQSGDAPIIRLINALLTESIKQGASDIHVETYEKRLLVRFRIDGVLREVVQPKRALAALLVSRIKVMAKLDIAEKRVPQDGRIALRIGGREVDVRVSTMPSQHGERVVMRLLDKQAGRLSLSQLGMSERDLSTMRRIISQPHGIILVTGPTGSGKTTTLYGALSDLNDASRNILTVEDPVEYSLPGIGQTQVSTKTNMTFAKGLRAILRQDPDVVMIGEIRDLETVEIAIQASLTGHLVLSTLHTNTAVGAVTRLQDMGVEPFLLSSSIIGVMAQRLVRLLCPKCKEAYEPDDAEAELLQLDPDAPKPTIYKAKGCEHCNQLGYKGRQGIYEIIEVDEIMKSLIHDKAGEQQLTAHARELGPSIQQDGIRKVLAGETSTEELLRVVKG